MVERRLGDDRGAILVMGVFFAVFMTGILFYVSVLAEAVLLQGELQNAADVAAFGVAITHANGMNAIVRLNQTMSALLALLVGLRLTEMLAALGIAVASSFAFVPGLAALIPALVEVQQQAEATYQKLDSPVHTALKTLHRIELGLAASVPAIAVAAHTSRGPGPRAAATPTKPVMPVESDDFSVLCHHAAEDAASIALVPLRALGLPGEILDPIESSVGDLAVEAGGAFCGKAGGKAPRIEHTVDRVLPLMSSRAACEDGAARQAKDVAGACSHVERDEAQSSPSSDGECRERCGPSGPFEERVQQAREQCDPRASAGLRGFQWSERTVTLRKTRNGGLERVRESATRMIREPKWSGVFPCGGDRAQYSRSYEPKVHPDGGRAVAPVCAGDPRAVDGGKELEVVEVVHIFQCVLTEKKVIEMKGPPVNAGNAGDESPMRVTKDVSAGSEDFQIRGVGLVESGNSWKDKVVEATAYSRAVADSDQKLTSLGRMALSEAEYGFDGSAASAAWMWTAQWTAHLARVRAPARASVTAGFVAACEAGTDLHGACVGAGTVLAGMATQVVH